MDEFVEAEEVGRKNVWIRLGVTKRIDIVKLTGCSRVILGAEFVHCLSVSCGPEKDSEKPDPQNLEGNWRPRHQRRPSCLLI